MIELMARFRQQQSRSRLVAGMAGFLREHPGFVPGNYAMRSEVPVLFNHAAPLRAAGAATLDNDADTRVLVDLLHRLPKPVQRLEAVTPASAADVQESTLVAARQQALKEDVERFYLAVVEQQGDETISALDYLERAGHDWSPEIWLFQVIAEYQGLPRTEQRAFRLQHHEEPASPFNDLRLIHDVVLRLVA